MNIRKKRDFFYQIHMDFTSERGKEGGKKLHRNGESKKLAFQANYSQMP